jgi:hypothetical protein
MPICIKTKKGWVPITTVTPGRIEPSGPTAEETARYNRASEQYSRMFMKELRPEGGELGSGELKDMRTHGHWYTVVGY